MSLLQKIKRKNFLSRVLTWRDNTQREYRRSKFAKKVRTKVVEFQQDVYTVVKDDLSAPAQEKKIYRPSNSIANALIFSIIPQALGNDTMTFTFRVSCSLLTAVVESFYIMIVLK